MHYYQWNIGDYASHTAHLDELEDLAYRRMIDYCYLNEIGLPESVDEVARLIRMRTHTGCIANVLREFFDLHSDGVYRHPRIEREIQAFRDKSGKAAKAAHKRWEKERANALRTQSECNANQEPITNNQEPETSKQITSPNGSSPPTPYDQIIDVYHRTLPELPAVRMISDKRKRAIKIRHRDVMDGSLENWERYFQLVRSADFLMGRVKDWRADFDFLLREGSITGVIEGKYHGNAKSNGSLDPNERGISGAERTRRARELARQREQGAGIIG